MGFARLVVLFKAHSTCACALSSATPFLTRPTFRRAWSRVVKEMKFIYKCTNNKRCYYEQPSVTVTPMALDLCVYFFKFFYVTTGLVCNYYTACGVTSVCAELVSLETTTFEKDCTLLNCYKLTTAAKKKKKKKACTTIQQVFTEFVHSARMLVNSHMITETCRSVTMTSID